MFERRCTNWLFLCRILFDFSFFSGHLSLWIYNMFQLLGLSLLFHTLHFELWFPRSLDWLYRSLHIALRCFCTSCSATRHELKSSSTTTTNMDYRNWSSAITITESTARVRYGTVTRPVRGRLLEWARGGYLSLEKAIAGHVMLFPNKEPYICEW